MVLNRHARKRTMLICAAPILLVVLAGLASWLKISAHGSPRMMKTIVRNADLTGRLTNDLPHLDKNFDWNSPSFEQAYYSYPDWYPCSLLGPNRNHHRPGCVGRFDMDLDGDIDLYDFAELSVWLGELHVGM